MYKIAEVITKKYYLCLFRRTKGNNKPHDTLIFKELTPHLSVYGLTF